MRERVESWGDDPECDGTDAAHPAYWRGHDHAVAVLCQKVTEILDGKDDGKGIARAVGASAAQAAEHA